MKIAYKLINPNLQHVYYQWSKQFSSKKSVDTQFIINICSFENSL